MLGLEGALIGLCCSACIIDHFRQIDNNIGAIMEKKDDETDHHLNIMIGGVLGRDK